MNLNFATNNFQELAHALYHIQDSYYQGTEPYNPNFLKSNLVGSHTLFAFDCSRSDESLINSTVDVRLEINSRLNIPANTIGYCLIISDSEVEYSPFNGIVNKRI